MGIKDRIIDAVVLHQLDRKDGALLSALSAAASTARLRYPSESMAEAEAFTAFLSDEWRSVYGLPDEQADRPPVSHAQMRAGFDVLFRYFASHTFVQARLPATVEFKGSDAGRLEARHAPGQNRFVFSDNWLSALVRVVTFARENDGWFDEVRANNACTVDLTVSHVLTKQETKELLELLLPSAARLRLSMSVPLKQDLEGDSDKSEAEDS